MKIMKFLLIFALILSFSSCKPNDFHDPDYVPGGTGGITGEEITAAQPQTAEPVPALQNVPPMNPDIERERYRISIKDNIFVVDADNQPKPIWINGTNTPWDRWNDFGGSFRAWWWNDHFAELRENGVNASRVWINCNNGQNAVIIDEAGLVSGVSDRHWEHLDEFFEIAERHGIYIMATFTSFDHFKHNPSSNHFQDSWRNMLKSAQTIDSFVQHYTIPFVQRYGDNPFLWSIDFMNEPCWVHENDAINDKRVPRGEEFPWEYISHFFARNAAAVRENAPQVLTTVGMAFPKYNSDLSGYEGNKISDEFLQSLYNNPNARLDFWSPHYYDWVAASFGHPFTSTPTGERHGDPRGWGLCDSKPALIGETSANGSHRTFTLVDDYENAFKNGWLGVMAWTSNGVDDNGGLYEQTAATRYIAHLYPELVWPLKY
jgi:hypothetical protein